MSIMAAFTCERCQCVFHRARYLQPRFCSRVCANKREDQYGPSDALLRDAEQRRKDRDKRRKDAEELRERLQREIQQIRWSG